MMLVRLGLTWMQMDLFFSCAFLVENKVRYFTILPITSIILSIQVRWTWGLYGRIFGKVYPCRGVLCDPTPMWIYDIRGFKCMVTYNAWYSKFRNSSLNLYVSEHDTQARCYKCVVFQTWGLGFMDFSTLGVIILEWSPNLTFCSLHFGFSY